LKLVINTPGIYLCKRGECFSIQKDQDKQEISAKKVEQILITTRAALSTDAIELAVENNIDIVFLKYSGQPLGRVWHSRLGSISTIRRKQLFLQDHPLGLKLVKSWIDKKLENQINHLEKLSINRRDERQEEILSAIEKIKVQKEKIQKIDNKKTVEDLRGTLLGSEGTAGRAYFETLGKILPKKYQFSGRSKNPAKDPFNCLLNYSYGILYSNVEKACIIAGLDPYIGIMHTDNYNKKALVFDIIEMYRINMEELVVRLFSKRKIKGDFFDEIEGGYYLNKKGKQALLEVYHQDMEKKVRYHGRNIEKQNIIQFDCHRIANLILEEGPTC